MTVARRFIAGSGTTWGLRPGGTPEYRRAINPKVSIVPPGHTATAAALNAEMSKPQAPQGLKGSARRFNAGTGVWPFLTMSYGMSPRGVCSFWPMTGDFGQLNSIGLREKAWFFGPLRDV